MNKHQNTINQINKAQATVQTRSFFDYIGTALSVSITLTVFPVSTAIAQEATEPFSRPLLLVEELEEGPLKKKMQSCVGSTTSKTDFSISHRGAPLGFAEHTEEAYRAAAAMGAGIIECDVTFTKDRALVCRHSQCDLHSTTNILATPLAENCSIPPDYKSKTPFKEVKCCTSDITVKEFKSLSGKMDFANKNAATLAEYLNTPPPHRLPSSVQTGKLLTHSESIRLFKSLGVKMIPELKAPQVDMPYEGVYSQQQYAQALIDEYLEQDVEPGNVVLQSFNLDDVLYWNKNNPEFAANATWLDGRYRDKKFIIDKAKSWKPSMQELANMGVANLAPPLWMLLDLDSDNNLAASAYAESANEAGLNLIAWTLERSGPLAEGGGWYYQTVNDAINNDSDTLRVLDVLAKQAGVAGVFSDWPATTTFYANCAGLP